MKSIRTDGVIFATAETKDDLEWCLKQAARSDGNYECLPGFAYVNRLGDLVDPFWTELGVYTWVYIIHVQG